MSVRAELGRQRAQGAHARSCSCLRRVGPEVVAASTTRSRWRCRGRTASTRPATASWGFSPASNPFGGYSEYGVDLAGYALRDGYRSDVEKTDVDVDRPGCSEGTNPDPEFGDGMITPHASFSALTLRPPGRACEPRRASRKSSAAYGPGGDYDAVAVGCGTVAERSCRSTSR